MENCLVFWDQGIEIGDSKSSWFLITMSDTPQGLIFCLMLFNVIISGLDNGMGCLQVCKLYTGWQVYCVERAI